VRFVSWSKIRHKVQAKRMARGNRGMLQRLITISREAKKCVWKAGDRRDVPRFFPPDLESPKSKASHRCMRSGSISDIFFLWLGCRVS
jgi:hypothetical protein